MIVDKDVIWVDKGPALAISPTTGVDLSWGPTGSFILDGISEGVSEMAVEANGGVVLGGNALVSMTGGVIERDFVADGGIVFGGDSLVSHGTYNLKDVVADGGIVFGGNALYSFTEGTPQPLKPVVFVVS